MLREESLAGAVYALVDAETTRVGAVGFAHHASGTPMSPDSKVHVGSVTKTLIALGVLRLATQQRVDLDAPLAELLPDVRLRNPWNAQSPVRLRHLLDHTSGLDDLHLWHLFTKRAPPRAPLADAFARPDDLLRVRVEPGTRMSYSNLGYTLAAMVIEARTGERYESWLERELLAPLGMHDSTFEFVSQQGERADSRLAWGHHDDLSLAAAQPVWVRPAAQFTTTAADMAALAQFLMGDGVVDGAELVRSALLAEMGRPRTTEAARADLDIGYSLGLATRDRHGVIGRCHGGNIVGFWALLCVYPEQRKAFFISYNTDSETASYSRLEKVLIEELAPGVETAPSRGSTLPAKPADYWAGRYVAAPARIESFRLVELLFDSLRLQETEGGLQLRRFGRNPVTLVPMGDNLYRGPERLVASHVLMDDGDVRLSDGLHTWRRIPAAVFTLHWACLVLGLAGMLCLLLLIPWRALRCREPWLQPASVALGLLLLSLPLFAFQSFMSLGDFTLASASLFAATLTLPFLMAWQVVWAWRNRVRVRSWPVHVAASMCVLSWSLWLWSWNLLPLALWR